MARTVAVSAASAATSTLTTKARWKSTSSRSTLYQSSENPTGGNEMKRVVLNDVVTTMAVGRTMNTAVRYAMQRATKPTVYDSPRRRRRRDTVNNRMYRDSAMIRSKITAAADASGQFSTMLFSW